MGVVLIILIGSIVVGCALLLGGEEEKIQEKAKEYRNTWLRDNNVTPTSHFSYVDNILNISIDFVADDVGKGDNPNFCVK